MLFFLKTLIYIDVLIAATLLLFRWALLPRYRALVSSKLAAIALAMPAVALLSGNVYLLYLSLALVVAFNSSSRLELAGVFLFLLPSTPMLAKETMAGGVYLFPISTLLAMGTGALVGALATRRRGTARLPRYDLAVCIIIGLLTFIDHRDLNPTDALRGLTVNVLTFAGPYLLVSRAARDLADVERLLLRWSLGATVMATTACFQAWRHWVLFETYFQALHIPLPLLSAATSMRGGLLRTGGSMVDYSAGGLFLATVVTVFPQLRRAFRPVGFWVVLATLVLGLIATQSRGAWVAAVAGLAALAAWRGQWGRLVLVVVGAAVANLAVTLFAPSSRLAAMLGHTGNGQDTAAYRRDLATQGLAQVRSHPLFGQSPKQLVHNLSDLTQGEHIVDFVNSHLFIAMAAGVPLFFAWCVIWLMPVADGWRQRRNGVVLAAAPMAIMVPALIALTFTSMGDRNLTWPTIALALAVPCLKFGRIVAQNGRQNFRGHAGPPVPAFVSHAAGNSERAL